eukprot:scaffold41147_cov69-Phaeocystis_antarctica.AAC.4
MEPIDPNPLDSEGEDWAKKHMKEKKAKGNEWVHQQQQTKPKKSAPHKSKQRHATQLEVMAEMSERSEEDIVESDDSINKFIIDDEEDTPRAFRRLSKSAKKQRSRREAILEEMKIGQDKRHAKNADAKEFPDKSKKPNKESKADFPKGKVKKPLRKKAMSQPELSEFEQFKQTAKDDVEREQRENQALREQIAAMRAAQQDAPSTPPRKGKVVAAPESPRTEVAPRAPLAVTRERRGK